MKSEKRDLSYVKMKSMFVIGFIFTSLMGMFNSIFDGRVVGKLPFTPISLLQGKNTLQFLAQLFLNYPLSPSSIFKRVPKNL